MKQQILLSLICFPLLLFSQIDSTLKKITDAEYLVFSRPKTIDSLFLIYLNEMDSVIKKHKFDSVYLSGRVLYMEMHSGIFAKAGGTYVGKLYFTKSEHKRWRQWYLEKIRKEMLSSQ